MKAAAAAGALPLLPVRLVPFLAGLLALAVYLLTLKPDLTWAYHSADGAELITAACTLGVPHPPGYPTYVLAGRLLCALPLEPIARSFNFASAVAAAAAAGLVTASARSLVSATAYSRRGALAAGLFLAWLLPIWQQAVVAEVYALNLLFLAAFLWTLLGRRPAGLSGLLLGLAITSHLTSLFMVPLALALLPRRRWPALAGGICLGLLPYLALPILAESGSPVIWGRPSTASGWWWLVSARLYRPNLFALPSARWGPRLLSWGSLLLSQLAVVAILWLPGRPRQTSPAIRIRLRAFLPSLLLYLVFAFTYDSEDSLLFLLPALLLLAILLSRSYHLRPTLALCLPIALLLLNFTRLAPELESPPRALAEPVMQAAAPGTILLTDGDRSTFTLWYLQNVEGHRPDLMIVDRHLLGFAWYRERLQQYAPDLAGIEAYDLRQFYRENERPIQTVHFPTPGND